MIHDVRDITLARNDHEALVSYENKAPPQLWKLDLVKDIGRLSLRHTYMPKVPVDFAGPSYFGGKDDQLILCAGKAGDIHIWDRESGALLHHVRAQVLGGDLTCIAWNHAQDSFMFATGSHDGAVRIWTTPLPTITFQPSSEYLDGTGSRGSINPTPTPRSASPFGFEFRTESPAVQTFLDSREIPPDLRSQIEVLIHPPSDAGSLDEEHFETTRETRSVTFEDDRLRTFRAR